VKGFEKAVGRVRTSIKEKEKIKEAKEKIPAGENYQKLRH
jgi:hypothetical protein